MSLLRFAGAGALLAAVLLAAPATAQNADPERAGIERAIQFYFDATDRRDPALLRAGFHPAAIMFWNDRGRLTGLAQGPWQQRMRAPDAPSLQVRDRQIAMLRRTGPLALVEIRQRFADRSFADVLLVARLGDGWRIVAKAFHRAAPEGTPPLATGDRAAIEEVLRRKLRSMDENDPELLGSTYDPRATSFHVEHGELVTVSIAEWQARFAERRASGQVVPKTERRILEIGGSADVGWAAFEHRADGAHVIDLAILVRTDAGWKIVALGYQRADDEPQLR